MTARRRHLLRSIALFAVVLVGLLGLLAWQDARIASTTSREHLDAVVGAQRLVETQEARDLATRAQLIAGNQAVVGYVTQALGGALPGTTVDSTSIVDLLEERRDQLGLAVAAVLDSGGRLVATTERFSADRDFSQEPLFVDASKAQTLRDGLWIDGSRLLHIAILPLASYGSGDAYLLVGTPVGQPFAQTIAKVGAADVALVAATPEGRVVVASTLDPHQQAALSAAMPAGDATDARRLRVDIDGTPVDAMVAPLMRSSKAQLVALVTSPRSVGSFIALHLPLVLGGLLTLLLVATASSLVWTRVLGPLEQLGAVMARAADQNDLRLTVPERGIGSVSRLAATCNRLLARLA